MDNFGVGGGRYTTMNEEVHSDWKNTYKSKDRNMTDIHVNENTEVSTHLGELEGDS